MPNPVADGAEDVPNGVLAPVLPKLGCPNADVVAGVEPNPVLPKVDV